MLGQQVQASTDTFAPQPLRCLEIAAESQRAFVPRDQADLYQTTDAGKTTKPERAAIAASEWQCGQDQQQAESEKRTREQVEHPRGLGGASQAYGQQDLQLDSLQGLPGPRREDELHLPTPKRHPPHSRLHLARNEVTAQRREWLAIVDLLQEIGKGVSQTRGFPPATPRPPGWRLARWLPMPGYPRRPIQAIAQPNPCGLCKRVRRESGTIVGGQPLVQVLSRPLARPQPSILLKHHRQLPPFIQQTYAQFLASTPETRFDRADRPTEHLSDLDLAEIGAVTQGDYPALIGVQVRESPTQFFAIGNYLLWIPLV
jgi:hypothetical protein